VTLSSRILDGVQLALDIGGLVPVVGEACDATNVLIHVARGNKAEALISAAAMIPVAGAAVVSGKFATKAGKALANNADKLDEIAEAASNVAQAARRNPQQDAANIRRINNAIRDHLKPKDIAGALRDALGNPVINPSTGKAYNHLEERLIL
jgi:hypothetical protein